MRAKSKKTKIAQKTAISEKPGMAEVISIVAHQLKDPLSVIKGYIEILLSEDFGEINEKQKEYLNDALSTVRRLSDSINQFLDVSKIEEAKFTIEMESVSLEDIIQDVVKEFSIWARASNCKIIFEKPQGLPKVLTDPLRIRQAIENLVSNSLIYKGPGQGIVEISLSKRGKAVIFMCKDNGIGIPEEDFKKVFTKFYRSERAVEIYPDGNGLGLYISKAIVEASGGKIWFEKNRGSGVTFSFSVPIAPKQMK